MTPVTSKAFHRSVSTRGATMADALGLSKAELDQYKSKITKMQTTRSAMTSATTSPHLNTSKPHH